MIASLFSRHQKIALEVSGGKDSLALLVLMKEYLSQVTIYWCNPGDPDPNTVKSMDWVRTITPNFVEIRGDIEGFRKQFGAATSVVPMSSVEFPTISDQMCCMHNIMIPMQNRVLADGNTCIIRGQKACDEDKGQLHSGDVVDGVEYVYPLEAWSDNKVLQFLMDNGVEIPPVYRYSPHGIDCLHCTGWWKHDHMGYLKERHSQAYQHVSIARAKIKAAVKQELALC